MTIHIFVHIWFPSLEPSWVQICLCHLGSPMLLWPHCVLPNLLQVLTLPAITSWLDVTSQHLTYTSQHRGWLHRISPPCRYFIFICCQEVLSCSACCLCTLVRYVATFQRQQLASLWDYHMPSSIWGSRVILHKSCALKRSSINQNHALKYRKGTPLKVKAVA